MSEPSLEPLINSAQLEADRRVVRAAALLLIDTALALIEGDPHSWSERPCPTCRPITQMVGRPFGCYRLALEREAGRRKAAAAAGKAAP